MPFCPQPKVVRTSKNLNGRFKREKNDTRDIFEVMEEIIVTLKLEQKNS